MTRTSLACFALGAFVFAATQALADSVATVADNGFGRIVFTLDPVAHAKATLADGVLTISFDRKIAIDPAAAAQGLGAYVTAARLDSDGQTLHLALAQNARLHTSLSGNRYAVDLAPQGFAGLPPDLPPPPPVQVAAIDIAKLDALPIRVGAYSNYTRLVFDWPRNVPYTVFPGSAHLTVRFEALARPDFSSLTRVSPPWVKTSGWRAENRGLVIELETDAASGYHAFRDGNHVVLDILAPKTDADAYRPPGIAKPTVVALTKTPDVTSAQTQAIADTAAKLANRTPDTAAKTPAVQQAQPAPVSVTPNPAPSPATANAAATPAMPEPPAAPVVQSAQAQRSAKGAVLTFPGAKAAAVFVRGMTAWIVIDGKQTIDPAKLKAALGDYPASLDAASGNGLSVLHIALKQPAEIAARSEGANLKVILAERVGGAPQAIGFSRSDADKGGASLTALLPGATHAVTLSDPQAGDTLLVVPAPPGRAVGEPRAYAEFALLPTGAGIVVAPFTDDLSVRVADSHVTIARPKGLTLTPPAPPTIDSPAQLAGSGEGPSFIDFAAWKGAAPAKFLETERKLGANIASQKPDEANRARLTLARFYLANNFAAETLGLIALMQSSDPSLDGDPRLATMRAAADIMMARYKDAHNDIAGQAFDDDRHAALWRGLADAALENWDSARRELDQATPVLRLYPAEWQTRARIAQAQAAIATGGLESADRLLAQLPRDLPKPLMLDAELSRARLDAQEGRTRDALALFGAVENGGDDQLAAQAIYDRVDTGLACGAITRDGAIAALEALRFRWRGDGLELKTLRKLGALYFAKRDWRQGLQTLRAATQNFGDDDRARQAQDDMRAAFEALFLKGKADAMPPVEALALFYDFIELTPIGPDGDEMIRRMADRLVGVDLLEPAAKLLDYQVTKRLDGVARAQVATRLAMIELLDHKPKDALEALRSTDVAGLPDDVGHERAVLQARALAALKQWDQALDMIATDEAPDSRRLRADIYWESGNWSIAGQKAEELAGASSSDASPLSPETRQQVMRAAIAYSLAGDQTSLDRLRERFAAGMKPSTDASAFAVVTQDIAMQGIAFRDMAGQIASVDTLETFMQDFKKHYDAGGRAN
jgi:hypothetical protein